MRRMIPSDHDDVLVMIPKDKQGGTYLKRIERAVRWCWSRGLYPSPSAVCLRLHGHSRRTLNGKETSVRNRLLEELGIGRQRDNSIPSWYRYVEEG